MKDEIVLYQPNETTQLQVRLKDETVWLNRNQMSILFSRDVKTIGKHINNALREELCSVVAENATTGILSVPQNTAIQPTENRLTQY